MQSKQESSLSIHNLFLESIPRESGRSIIEAGKIVEMRSGTVLAEAMSQLRYVYFPSKEALISLLSVTDDGDLAEVGVIGGEGLAGFGAAMDAKVSTHRIVVQIGGRALRVSADAMRKQLLRDPQTLARFFQFLNVMFAQVSQTALCNRMHSVEERLARWLLVSMDRVDSQLLPLTHETLAHMLGTRRSTVSLTAAVLQEAGVIRYRRGKIEVLDRARLEEVACDCYQIVRKQLGDLYPIMKRSS